MHNCKQQRHKGERECMFVYIMVVILKLAFFMLFVCSSLNYSRGNVCVCVCIRVIIKCMDVPTSQQCPLFSFISPKIYTNLILCNSVSIHHIHRGLHLTIRTNTKNVKMINMTLFFIHFFTLLWLATIVYFFPLLIFMVLRTVFCTSRSTFWSLSARFSVWLSQRKY